MESSYTTKAQLRSSLQRVADKIESAEDKIDVLSGVANGITARIESAEDDISSLQTQVDGISVPTKTSELTNDSGYIKSVNGKSANAAGAVLLDPPDIGAASNRNLLDNCYFPDPINQKDQMSYGANMYGIDRWYNSNLSVELSSGGVQVTHTSGAPGDAGFLQRIDTHVKRAIIGKTVTLSFLIRDFSSSGENQPYINLGNARAGSLLTNVQIGSGLQLLSVTKNIPSTWLDTDSVWMTIGQIARQFSFKLIAAKLELGSKQTLAHKDANGNWVLSDQPPNRALELAKCQRHYVKNHYEYFETIGLCAAISTWINLSLSIPVPMRIRYPVARITGTIKVAGRDLVVPALTHCSVVGNNVNLGFSYSDEAFNGYISAISESGVDIEIDANL